MNGPVYVGETGFDKSVNEIEELRHRVWERDEEIECYKEVVENLKLSNNEYNNFDEIKRKMREKHENEIQFLKNENKSEIKRLTDSFKEIEVKHKLEVNQVIDDYEIKISRFNNCSKNKRYNRFDSENSDLNEKYINEMKVLIEKKDNEINELNILVEKYNNDKRGYEDSVNENLKICKNKEIEKIHEKYKNEIQVLKNQISSESIKMNAFVETSKQNQKTLENQLKESENKVKNLFNEKNYEMEKCGKFEKQMLIYWNAIQNRENLTNKMNAEISLLKGKLIFEKKQNSENNSVIQMLNKRIENLEKDCEKQNESMNKVKTDFVKRETVLSEDITKLTSIISVYQMNFRVQAKQIEKLETDKQTEIELRIDLQKSNTITKNINEKHRENVEELNFELNRIQTELNDMFSYEDIERLCDEYNTDDSDQNSNRIRKVFKNRFILKTDYKRLQERCDFYRNKFNENKNKLKILKKYKKSHKELKNDNSDKDKKIKEMEITFVEYEKKVEIWKKKTESARQERLATQVSHHGSQQNSENTFEKYENLMRVEFEKQWKEFEKNMNNLLSNTRSKIQIINKRKIDEIKSDHRIGEDIVAEKFNKVMKPNSDNTVSCPDCDRKFITRTHLCQHLTKTHDQRYSTYSEKLTQNSGDLEDKDYELISEEELN